MIHDVVSAVTSRLTNTPKDQVLELADSRWERGSDGHLRERAKRTHLWPFLDDLLHSVPDYDKCVQQLKRDPAVGPHLDHLVGTIQFSHRIDADKILQHLIYAMVDDEGIIEFSDQRFESEWKELVDFFIADLVKGKVVAPLPNLVLPAFPLRLNDELVLDQLTDDEVTRCCQAGILRPVSPSFPLLHAKVGVGVRRTIFLPKSSGTDEESNETQNVGDVCRFGRRPMFRNDLVIDDVLSAMRLFKHTETRAAGNASWSESPWLAGSTSFQVLGQWPYGGQFVLSEGEVPQFLELWRLLEERVVDFGFSIRRFNLAFERGLAFDRVVDLVIAAESLFLSDIGVQDRGELRFRFAIRAAKFIEHPTYSERDVYRVMRQAYDARSAIVHGGSPNDTHLPGDQAANESTFIDTIEELVRLGLRKAISMGSEGRKLRQPEYWENLLFSGSNF